MAVEVRNLPDPNLLWGQADPNSAQVLATTQHRFVEPPAQVVQQQAQPVQQVVMQPVQRDIARSNNNYNPTNTYQYGQQTGIMPPINHAQPFTNLTHMVSPYTGQVFNLTGYPSKYPHMIFGDLFDTTAPYVNAIIPWLQMGMQMAGSQQQTKAPVSGGSTSKDKTSQAQKTKSAELPPELNQDIPWQPRTRITISDGVTSEGQSRSITPEDASRFSGPTSISHHNGAVLAPPTVSGSKFLITPPTSNVPRVDTSTTGLLEAAGVAPATVAPQLDQSTTGLLEAAGIVPAGSLAEVAGVAAAPVQPQAPASPSQQFTITPPATGATTRRTVAPTVSNAHTTGPQSLVEAAGISNTTPEGVYLLGNGQGMTRDGNVVVVQQDALTGQYRYFDLSGNPVAIF